MSDYDLIVQAIGEDAARKLCDKLGGGTVYIPKAPVKEARNKIIREQFTKFLNDGSTCMNAYNAIARAYQVSPRQVQNICNN